VLSDERGAWYVLVRILLWGGAVAAILMWLLHRGDRPAPERAPPSQETVPHAMVGVWTSTRGTTMRCIELHADGGYNMVPNTAAGDTFAAATGTWRVVGPSITWRDDSQGGAVDINRMVDVTESRFTTVEADGSTTKFALIAGTVTARCPK